MSELTEKAKKEIKNEIKEQKRRKNVLWVISHRRENTGNMQFWPQKKTDVSFLVQNYYYNCLIWKLCANNPPWFLRNSPPCTHPLASPLHVAVITAGQNSKLCIVKKTYFYLKQGWMRGVQSLSAEGQAWLLLPTGEKKYCQPLPLQLLAILLSLLLFLLITIIHSLVRNLLCTSNNISSGGLAGWFSQGVEGRGSVLHGTAAIGKRSVKDK